MRKFITVIALLLSSLSYAQNGLGDVVGTVIDKTTQEPIYNARVFILDQGNRYITSTDFDGRFKISAVPPGEYLLKISHQGDTMDMRFVDIPIDGYANAGVMNYTNDYLELGPVIAMADDGSIKMKLGLLPTKELKADEIAQSAIKFNIKALATSISPDVKLMDDGSLVFRGARKGDMIYMVDGVKVTGELNIPSTSIGRMMVYSGGLPANYGDTMGGVIVVESKSYFELLRNYESMQMKKEAKIKYEKYLANQLK